MKACWVEGPWCPRARGWPLPREGPAPYPGQALPLLEAQASPSASPSRGRSQAKDPQAPLSPVYSLLPESSPTPRARATKWVLPARKGAPLARAPRRAGAKEPETHARPLSVPVLLPPLAVRASPWAVLGVRGLPRGAGVPGASLLKAAPEAPPGPARRVSTCPGAAKPSPRAVGQAGEARCLPRRAHPLPTPGAGAPACTERDLIPPPCRAGCTGPTPREETCPRSRPSPALVTRPPPLPGGRAPSPRVLTQTATTRPARWGSPGWTQQAAEMGPLVVPGPASRGTSLVWSASWRGGLGAWAEGGQEGEPGGRAGGWGGAQEGGHAQLLLLP